MANIVKLKRSAVSGKKPGTATLELGELAINTFDGRAFFKRNNGTEEVVEISINQDSARLEVKEWTSTGENSFTLSQKPLSKELVSVFISGVHQHNSEYNLYGNNIVFIGGIPAGEEIRAVSFLESSIDGGAEIETVIFNLESGQTTQTLEHTPIGLKYITISIEGSIQSLSEFSLNNKTVTLPTGLVAGMAIEITSVYSQVESKDVAAFEIKEYISTLNQDTFSLENTPLSKDNVFVIIDGITQYASDYDIFGNDVIMSSPLWANAQVRIVSILKIAFRGMSSVNTSSPRYLVISGDFLAEPNRPYITNLSAASVCTLPYNPRDGDTIEVMDGAGTFDTYNLTINRNGGKIQGEENNLILNVANSTLKLVYISALGDWRIANRYSDY